MTSPSRAVAVVGLGAMGGPMSRRLLSAGLEVRGFDRDADAMARFCHAGGVPATSATLAAEGAAALLLLVVNDAQADDVLFGAGNAAVVLAPGAVAQALASECLLARDNSALAAFIGVEHQLST